MVFPANVTAQPAPTVVAPPADVEVDDVARPTDDSRVIERDTRLGDDLRVVIGEQVDGVGRVEPMTVRSGVQRIGPRLTTCYGQAFQRAALREGTMILLFDVTSSGAVARVGVQNDQLGDAGLRRCVRQAAEALRFDGAAIGGTATYSYTLRFGR